MRYLFFIYLTLLACLPSFAAVTTDADITGVSAGLVCSVDGEVPTGQGDGTMLCEAPPGASGGDAWGDPVDASIVPDTDDTYDLGDATHQFKDAYIDGTLEADAITLNGTALGSLFTALAAADDNDLIRANGTSGQVQGSGITVDDSNNISGAGTLSCGVITQSGATLANTYVALQASTDNRLVRFNSTAGQVQGSGITVSDADAVSGVSTLSTTGDITIADATNDGIVSITGNTGAAVKVTTSGEYKFVAGRWNGASRYSITPSTAIDGDTFSNEIFAATASTGAVAIGNATLNGAVSVPVTTEASNTTTAAFTVAGGIGTVKNVVVGGQMYSPLNAISGGSGSSETIDWNVGNTQTLDLGDYTGGGAVTLTLSNPASGGYYCLKVIQETTSGARTITWPAAVKWPAATACTLSTGDEAIDLVCGMYDGSNYLMSCRNTYG